MMGAVDEWEPEVPDLICDVCHKPITDDVFYDLDGPVCKGCVKKWLEDVPTFYETYIEDSIAEYMDFTHERRQQNA